jgi:hypothetical protein
MGRGVARIGMLLWALPLLAGCAAWFFGDVDDLRFQRAVRLQREAAPAIGFFSLRESPYPEYLKISVSSAVDIGAMAERAELNIWTQEAFCTESAPAISDDEDGLFLFGPFLEGIPLPQMQGEGERALYERAIASVPAGQRYIYDLYAPVRGRPTPAEIRGGLPPPAYDLSARPQAICLLIGGGNMVGGFFRSNMVVVPQAAVAAALSP